MSIVFKNVEFKYQKNTPFERLAIHNINLDVPSGQYYAIIGHTGSGKSTILQHLNGLLLPTNGSITIDDIAIQAGGKQAKALKQLRKKVGVVFQFPEHQLFEETVEKDICFGPMNFGLSLDKAKEKAREMLHLVGLSDDLLDRSPFDLSGGQMRRVAIAGVLAMEPDILVLDEPTAGLDPRGRLEIMDMFYQLHKKKNITVFLVTHSMEDAAKYADYILVMHKGQLIKQGTPQYIFSEADELKRIGLNVPETVAFKKRLEQCLGITFPNDCMTEAQVVEYVKSLFNKGEAYDG
ncbi:energy-coupling factor ABC transporter ATP-binding protein [Bacillus sp. HMF5848]|uniref:energy-coupling factor ABC transporter ATP-binding protein n=1 Tax=Bacillus sp. HMF5848 TaxID=2495421 RepID=UPI000F7841C3|nr:energy-coupling factor ABC transporter ATP-binding protein [Bacillus sp. HMF5848]RSK25577.1 energy-coupling factor ABC transporter ATP-binding protein [Bacillus sp. HMF5848]